MPAEGHEDDVVGERVRAERRGAEVAADQHPVGVLVQLEEHQRRGDVPGEPADLAERLARVDEPRAPVGEDPEQEGRGADRPELLRHERPGPEALQRDDDRRDGAHHDTGHRPQLHGAEVHLAKEEMGLRDPERAEEEAARHRREQGLDLGVAVEPRREPRQRDPGDRAGETEPGDRPEHGRLVLLGHLLALHEGGRERHSGEYGLEGDEHEHHPGQAVLTRRQQPRQGDGHPQLRELERDPGDRLPGEPAQNRGAEALLRRSALLELLHHPWHDLSHLSFDDR